MNFVQAKEEEEEDEGKVQVDRPIVITSEADHHRQLDHHV